MLTERYFYNLFKQNEDAYKGKRIALYGTSSKASIILNNFPDFDFVAVLDGEKTGVFCGLPIIKPEEMVSMKIEVVIIVARNQNVAIIAERIKKICMENGIKVFSIAGLSIFDYGVAGQDKQVDDKGVISWRERMLFSNYRGIMEQELSDADEILVRLFAEKLMKKSPELDAKGRVTVRSLYDFAYCFIGPIVTSYVLFIIKQVQKKHYDKVLFAARDGFLIHKLYHLAKEKYALGDLPQDHYFYTSRMACISAGTFSEEDFFFLSLLPCNYEPKRMTEHRFCIEEGVLDEFNGNQYKSKLNYLMAHKEIILEAAEKLRKNYRKYLSSLGWDSRQKYAFVDLVSSGTCQLYLSQISDTLLQGIYLGNQVEFAIQGIPRRDLLPVVSMYERRELNEKNDWEAVHLFSHYWFLETVLTSFEPSVHCFDDTGTPVFSTEKRKEKDLEAIREMQSGIEAYFNDFIEKTEGCMPDIHTNIGDILYRYSDADYTNIQIPYLEKIILYEDLGMGELDAKSH